jgi:hypothetical protein
MIKNLTTAVFVMLSLSACGGSASLVRKSDLGGRVDLAGAYMPAMADARMLMVEHCQGRFQSVERGDHVEFRCTARSTQTELALSATDDGH